MKTKEEVLTKYKLREWVKDDVICFYDSKNRLAAMIKNGVFESRYAGRQNLCGSIAANDLKLVYGVK